jgi:hypothetical protein
MNFGSKITQTAYNEKEMPLCVSCLFLRKIIVEPYSPEKRNGLFELRSYGSRPVLSCLRSGEYSSP